MNGLGLSAEALGQRRKYVQAGDAARIMAGEWRAVWREKMGLAEPADYWEELPGYIKKNLPKAQVELMRQLGLLTEPLNLAWCEQITGREVSYYSGNNLLLSVWTELTGRKGFINELHVSEDHPFMGANLDGMTTTPEGHRCPVDAKRVAKSDDPLILTYTAAGVHQATVTNCDWWALSILVGQNKHEVIYQEVDPLYRAQLVVKEREFWGYVQRGEEPLAPDPAPVLPPKPAPKLRTLIVPTEGQVLEAMKRENNWLGAAIPEMSAFIGTDAAAKRNGIARSKLRDDLIPADVGLLKYGRYEAKRGKAGALTMVVEPMEDDDAP